jgi:hypothetical protein
MTKLAQLIATREGFFTPGTIPARRDNPGDLRHSPHSSHAGIGPNDIGEIDSVADGWSDEDRQLQRYAARGLTLGQAIYEWAPPGDGNDSAGYLQFIIDGFGGRVSAETPLSQVLEIAA